MHYIIFATLHSIFKLSQICCRLIIKVIVESSRTKSEYCWHYVWNILLPPCFSIFEVTLPLQRFLMSTFLLSWSLVQLVYLCLWQIPLFAWFLPCLEFSTSSLGFCNSFNYFDCFETYVSLFCPSCYCSNAFAWPSTLFCHYPATTHHVRKSHGILPVSLLVLRRSYVLTSSTLLETYEHLCPMQPDPVQPFISFPP